MSKVFNQFEGLTLTKIAWLAIVLVALGVYLFGLNSPYAPTNGDEMVYIHIARMTAESGHWLPLQSELIGTRNTKPPLLIWQAIVASDWGQNWDLFILRLPSVIYTFATTAFVAFFTYRLTSQTSARLRGACLAAALYLLFFSSFRYGRAYLTSAPETFWLALPMWWVLWLRLRPVSRPTEPLPLGWLEYTLFGIAMGLGAAYKSFALVAPAAAGLWCAVLAGERPLHWRTVWRTSAGVGCSAVLAIGVFALWFVLDPDPGAVWREFVVAENAGKLSSGEGYWHAAFFGEYPMWTQLLAYPVNTGLLAFVTIGFFWVVLPRGLQRKTYSQLSPALWVLLAWLLVWLVVFTIPSQRSERYVIPATPALAIAMALVWDRIGKLWFVITTLIIAPALVLLARIGWSMGEMGVANGVQVTMTLIASCAGLTAVFSGLVNGNWTRAATLISCLAVYATFGLMVQPLSETSANYNTTLQSQLRGRSVAVPNGFTGQYERFHFVLPGARITPYDAEGRNTGALYPDMPPAQRLDTLLGQFDAVVWLQTDLTETGPSCLPRCALLGSRWHVKSRHKEGEVTWDNVWYPQQWLFRREWLVTTARPVS